ncbi:MAG: hypothetical protein K6F92_04300 [Lachnospiraceae bacterium]|nr:hypothetical protein [Lachnospiraceae bacterium]
MKKCVKIAVLSVLGLLITCIIALFIYYMVCWKKKVDIAVGFVDFFSVNGNYNTDEYFLRDGSGLTINSQDEDARLGFYIQGEAFGDAYYNVSGVLFKAPGVSETTYMLPWSDDVYEQMENSSVLKLAGIDDETKQMFADALISVRKYLYSEGGEPDEKREKYFLNHLFGLDDMTVDIWELYKKVEVTRLPDKTIEVDGVSYDCEVSKLAGPGDLVRRLLAIPDIYDSIGVLGQTIDDTTIIVYMCDGRLIRFDGESDFMYLPDVDSSEISELSDVLGYIKGDVTYRRMPLSMNFWKEGGKLAIEVVCSPYDIDVDEVILYSYSDSEKYALPTDEAVNIFEMKTLRAAVEALRWKEFINGKSAN